LKINLSQLRKFLTAKKGQTPITDKVIGLIVAGFILFALMGTAYTQYVAGNPSTTYCPPYYNASSACPVAHTATYAIIMTMLLIGFVIMIWKSAKSK